MQSAPYVRPSDVAVVVDDQQGEETTYVARLPHGPVLVLAGTASLIWREATLGAVPDVASRVAYAAGVDVASIRSEVEAFLAELVAQRLLERTGARLPVQEGM